MSRTVLCPGEGACRVLTEDEAIAMVVVEMWRTDWANLSPPVQPDPYFPLAFMMRCFMYVPK